MTFELSTTGKKNKNKTNKPKLNEQFAQHAENIHVSVYTPDYKQFI